LILCEVNYQYERYPLKQPDEGLILGITYTQNQLEASLKLDGKGMGTEDNEY
jgi:hypothetical protein